MSEMKQKPVLILYLLAITAFIFALLKYIFVGSSISANFLVLEIFSFIGFISVVYFTDRLIRQNKKEKEDAEIAYKEKIDNLQQKIDHYKKSVDNLKKESNTDAKSIDEIDIIKKDLKEITTNASNIRTLGSEILEKIAHYYEIGLGVCYFKIKPSTKFSVQGVYGLNEDEILDEIDEKSGISGESIVNKKAILVNDVDEDYFKIESCSGSSKPKHLYFLPIVVNKETIGLIELATFKLINIDNYWDNISDGIKDLKVI